jgi:hypothetical protein
MCPRELGWVGSKRQMVIELRVQVKNKTDDVDLSKIKVIV